MAKIMIVDDDVELSENMAVGLRQAGHTVATTETILGALEKLRGHQPELVILDMMFPENPLGGLALAKEIRHDRELAALPIILLTGVNQHFPMVFASDPKEDCRPIQDFIEKPVEFKELVSRVADVLKMCVRDEAGTWKLEI